MSRSRSQGTEVTTVTGAFYSTEILSLGPVATNPLSLENLYVKSKNLNVMGFITKSYNWPQSKKQFQYIVVSKSLKPPQYCSI